MSRGKDRKGRSRSGAPFICLRHYVYDTPAYRSLTPADRCVYLAILRRYNGTNNGRIGLSVRAAAEEAGIHKDSVGACIRRLIDRGLVELANESDFLSRLAREYRLTHERCDRTGALPTKAFLRWSPEAAKVSTKAMMPANDTGQKATAKAAAKAA